MFPRLKQRFGTALDLVVEFSTLGEYSLDAPVASSPASAPPAARSQEPGLGGAGPPAGSVPARRTVAGGAAGIVPVATPAAKRRRERVGLRPAGQLTGSRRPGSTPPVEQECLTGSPRGA